MQYLQIVSKSSFFIDFLTFELPGITLSTKKSLKKSQDNKLGKSSNDINQDLFHS